MKVVTKKLYSEKTVPKFDQIPNDWGNYYISRENRVEVNNKRPSEKYILDKIAEIHTEEKLPIYKTHVYYTREKYESGKKVRYKNPLYHKIGGGYPAYVSLEELASARSEWATRISEKEQNMNKLEVPILKNLEKQRDEHEKIKPTGFWSFLYATQKWENHKNAIERCISIQKNEIIIKEQQIESIRQELEWLKEETPIEFPIIKDNVTWYLSVYFYENNETVH